jgi:asparagine synthase (glutamine-hydrolysing)
MSVQAGIWNFDGEPVHEGLLAQMSAATASYGPDGERTYVVGPVGMLYRPFHTTSESRLEQQPHISSMGNVITWDGRLDNREQVAPQLFDDLTDCRSDVDIVAAAFDRWGTDCFARLRGDWAVSVWCPKDQQLVLSRDYIGVRPLFYYLRHEQLGGAVI